MPARAGLFDPEFDKKSVNDPELNSDGIFDVDFATASSVVNPPFRNVASMMSTVLASFPVESNAYLMKPNDAQQKIAPLTLAYGQQPIPGPTQQQSEFQAIVGQWPVDLEPRLGFPNDRRVNVAPLTLPTGDQPPRASFVNTAERQTIDAWPGDSWQAQATPRSLAWQTPLLLYVPPPRFPYAQLLAWLSEDTRPQGQVKIAPLTLTYGDQPTPQGPLSLQERQSISSWPTEDWAAQTSRRSTAWLTIPDQPTPQGPLGQLKFQAVLAWFVDPILILGSPKSAAVLPPPPVVTFVPFSRPPAHLFAIWEDEVNYKVCAVVTTVANQSATDAPPFIDAIGPQNLDTLVRSWAVTWDAQTMTKSSGWNVPIIPPPPTIIGTSVPTRQAIILAHWPLDLEPRLPRELVTRPKTAPLTLVYGQQPTPGPALSAAEFAIVQSWPTDLEPHPSRTLLQRPKTVALTLPTGQQPPRKTIERMMQAILESWPADLEPRLGLPNNARVHLASLLAHKLSIIQARGSYVTLITAQGSYRLSVDANGSINFEDDV